VIHPKENRAKCSLEPLRGREGFEFWPFKSINQRVPAGYVRLSVEGPALSPADAASGILLIDATWRHASPMNQHFAYVPARSLAGFRTAYPRTSKLFEDPAEGLASIEALFIAHKILGRPTSGLLDGFFWRDKFLELNGWSDFLSPEIPASPNAGNDANSQVIKGLG
jgi:pre-rRNA-processing protein TSR3